MKIVITNAHWNNRGDEAANRALWGELRILYPSASVKFSSKTGNPLNSFPIFSATGEEVSDRG